MTTASSRGAAASASDRAKINLSIAVVWQRVVTKDVDDHIDIVGSTAPR
jgi:hypothetical protein